MHGKYWLINWAKAVPIYNVMISVGPICTNTTRKTIFFFVCCSNWFHSNYHPWKPQQTHEKHITSHAKARWKGSKAGHTLVGFGTHFSMNNLLTWRMPFESTFEVSITIIYYREPTDFHSVDSKALFKKNSTATVSKGPLPLQMFPPN